MRFKQLLSLLLILSSASGMLSACSKPADTATESPAPGKTQAVGETRVYKWFLESVTPAGESTIVTTGDGRIANESFVHWNNREYRLNAETQLDEHGLIVAQKITGVSPFGAKIDESFSISDGIARWQTPGEGGTADAGGPAFYLPNEWATVGAAGALVRAALSAMDGEIALYPSGSAKVEKLRQHDVETPSGTENLTLVAISGIGFTPNYLWFDEDMRVAAVGESWLGMLPDGWDPAVLKELTEIQNAEDAKQIAKLAGKLAHPLEQPLLIDNVNVVDVVNSVILPGRFVQVVDGKITAIAEEPVGDDDVLRINGAGKFLAPGLWDMHGHFSLSDGVLNIAGGITSVRDIGGEHDQVMELTEKFDSGEVIGPHTYRAGFMDRAGPFAAGWAAESLDDALARVDFFAENGYLQIKLYSSIEPNWVAPIAERAHSHGMRVSGHIPAFMSAEQAVRAGYDEIQHINMVFLNFLAGDREDTRKQLRFTLYGDEAGNLDLKSQQVQDFFALLLKERVVVDATAAIFETQLIHHSGEPDPTFAPVIDHLPVSVARPLYNPEMDMGDKVEAWARSASRQAEMLKALHDYGIQLVAGSDNMPAFTLHRELEVYQEAGIPAADVLKIATIDSASVIGVDDRTGSIEVGKDADLMLLVENPLEDVSAVRKATLIVKGNTVFRPDELYKAVGVQPFVESERF
jgi:imidazolonepropionase-like amidohydrolase